MLARLLRPPIVRSLAAVLTALLVVLELPRAAPAAVQAAAGSRPVVYVSSVNEIQVFDQRGNLKTPLRVITDQLLFPQGLWVDAHQNLWVANNGTNYVGYILMFPPGASKASRRIPVPSTFGFPTQIWVDAGGTLFSVDCNESYCHVDRHDVSGKWSHVVTPNVQSEDEIVGDNQGDLYVSGFSGLLNGNIVEALFKGAKSWQTIGFPFTLGAAQMAFDFLGRLTIADSSVGDVFSYQISDIQLQDAFRCYGCFSIAFDSTGYNLWALSAADPSTLSEFVFPGGMPEKSVQLSVAAASIAVSPAFAPPPPSAGARPVIQSPRRR